MNLPGGPLHTRDITRRANTNAPGAVQIDDVESLMAHEIPLRAELARRKLHQFLMEFWPVMSTDPFHDNWHLHLICEELEKLFYQVHNRLPFEYNLVINVPPGTTKSSIVMRAFPVWAWVNNPLLSFITGTYAMDLALKFADDSRDIIDSDLFRAFYPRLSIRPDRDRKSDYQIVVDNGDRRQTLGGSRYSTSSKAVITGVHGHFILIDDPIDPKGASATSDLNRLAVNEWMNETLPTRKKDKAVTPMVLIMQRLHEDDPTGNWLGNENIRVRHINLPAELIDDPDVIVKPKAWRAYYREGLLDTDRLSRPILHDMMSHLGQYGYAGQMLQTPKPPGKGMFNVDKIRILENVPGREALGSAVYYWDKAGTQGGGKFTAGVYMARMKSRNAAFKYVILKVTRGQWAAPQREDIILREALTAGPRVITWVEQEPGSGGKESAEGTKRNLNRHSLKVRLDSPQGNKISRADPFSVAVDRGEVAIVRGPWAQPFLNELRLFPLSKFMDQVDAASGAYAKLMRFKLAGAW